MTPYLTSERLLLRPHSPTDRLSSVNLFTDPEVGRGGSDGALSWRAAETLFRCTFGVEQPGDHDVWAVCTKHDGVYVGSAELKPRGGDREYEVVYVLGKQHWGRGYGTELGRLLLGHCFDTLGLDRVRAVVDPDNDIALRVVERLGFRKVGTLGELEEEMLIFAAENPRRSH